MNDQEYKAYLEKRISEFEIEPEDYEDQLDELLDEQYPALFGMEASYIMKKLDPTMYREELLNLVDSIDKEDDKRYMDLLDELERCGDD
jgi:hypothetical protein